MEYKQMVTVNVHRPTVRDADIHETKAVTVTLGTQYPGQVTLFFKNTDDVEKFAADMVQAVRRAYRHR